MATLCRAYTSQPHAHAAVERLLPAGIAGAEVQVLMGETAHDWRDAPVGSYAGTTGAHGELVGSWTRRGGLRLDPDARLRRRPAVP